MRQELQMRLRILNDSSLVHDRGDSKLRFCVILVHLKGLTVLEKGRVLIIQSLGDQTSQKKTFGLKTLLSGIC